MVPWSGQKKNMKALFSLGAICLLLAVGDVRGANYDPLAVGCAGVVEWRGSAIGHGAGGRLEGCPQKSDAQLRPRELTS